jgi:hypothetical protein
MTLTAPSDQCELQIDQSGLVAALKWQDDDALGEWILGGDESYDEFCQTALKFTNIQTLIFASNASVEGLHRIKPIRPRRRRHVGVADYFRPF